MNKHVFSMAIGLAMIAGSVCAQETRTASLTFKNDHGSVTEQQALLREGHASGEETWSAFSRNIGPGSSISGNGNDGLGSPASGNTRVAGAPAAGRADN